MVGANDTSVRLAQRTVTPGVISGLEGQINLVVDCFVWTSSPVALASTSLLLNTAVISVAFTPECYFDAVVQKLDLTPLCENSSSDPTNSMSGKAGFGS